MIIKWSDQVCSYDTLNFKYMLDNTNKSYIKKQLFRYSIQGRIQDSWLRGAWVGEGSGDRVPSRSKAEPW